MSGNKYSEETVQKILNASLKLFMEKGYEQTTVLDIVDEMGDLTRGAFYHHFKSKEEVLDALGDRAFQEQNPFEDVKELTNLNGLEKLKWVLSSFLMKEERNNIGVWSIDLYKSPAFIKKLIDENRNILAPMIQELIEEGIQDGSIKVQYPKLSAELFAMLINFWMIPTIFPCSEEEAWEKFYMIIKISEKIGLPVFDEDLKNLCEQKAIRTE